MNFWASWCEPCQQETPLLASWYTRQHGHVIVVGLDENDTAASALQFAKAKGVSYPIGVDPQLAAANAYGVPGSRRRSSSTRSTASWTTCSAR